MPKPQFSIQNLEFKIRRAFTLTELLIVIAIIGIITGLGLSAFAGAVELAREQRTRSIIAKIDQLIMERYESYRTRAVPIRVPQGIGPQIAARMRLNALRDLMRMELPDRKSDLVSGPCDYDPRTNSALYTPKPSLYKSYLRQINRGAGSMANWSKPAQSSECLYMILSTIQDGDKSALDFFMSEEIGDTDGDGMKEILDAWGNPISFVRWPAGYTVEQPGNDWKWGASATNNPLDFAPNDPTSKDFRLTLTTQTRDYTQFPDPFDPLKVDPRWSQLQKPFALRPLIFSAGRDKQADMFTDENTFAYVSGTADNAPDPYVLISVPYNSATISVPIGTPADADSDGYSQFADNITNHNLNPPSP